MAKEPFDPRFDPAFQPGFEAPVAAPSKRDSSPARVALEQRTEARVPVLDEDSAEEHVPGPRRPNPFLIALGAISVALIAGGLGAVQSVKGIFTSENISVDLDYISLNMLIFAAPLAIALGVATGIGVLFIYAVDYKKRHAQ